MVSLIPNSPWSQRLQDELIRLGHRTPLVGRVRSARIKSVVMGRVLHTMEKEAVVFEELEHALESLTLSVEPTRRFKLNVRSTLMDTAVLRGQRLWLKDLFKDLFARRRYWATAVAVLVLFVGTFGALVQVPYVSASKISTVEAVRGAVFVERDGTANPLTAGFLVEEGDRFIVKNDGWADVVFVDDTLVTFGPGTLAVVSRLWSDPGNESHTSISLNVESGRVWANVMNLLPNDSRFEMTSGEVMVASDRRATFDLFVEEDRKELRVFSNLVDFDVREKGVAHEGTLGRLLGFVLTEGVLSIEHLAPIEELVRSDVWVQSNLENREQHRARLNHYYAERVEQRAGILPGDVRYGVKRGFESVRLLMNFDRDAEADLRFNLASKRFFEAMSLFNRDEWKKGRAALEEYRLILIDLSHRDERLVPMIYAVLEESRKVVEGVNPSEPLYEVRRFIDALFVDLAPDVASLQTFKLQAAADRLGLALELVQIGAYDLARTALEDYQLGLESVLTDLPTVDFEERRELVLSILDQKLRDLEQLKLIASALTAVEGSAEVESQLQELRLDTLYQLNTLVIHLKERAVLHLGTFLQGVKADEATQREVLARLKKTVPLDLETMRAINDLESLYASPGDEVIRVGNSLSI